MDIVGKTDEKRESSENRSSRPCRWKLFLWLSHSVSPQGFAELYSAQSPPHQLQRRGLVSVCLHPEKTLQNKTPPHPNPTLPYPTHLHSHNHIFSFLGRNIACALFFVVARGNAAPRIQFSASWEDKRWPFLPQIFIDYFLLVYSGLQVHYFCLKYRTFNETL